MIRLSRVLPVFAFAMLPMPALAQSQLDRMEALSEQANALMNEALVIQLPQLEGQLPSPDWDAPMRAAFSCVLDGYRDDIGDGGIDRMLDQLEASLSEATPEAMLNGEIGQQIDLPEGVSPERGSELMTACGVMELYMARMMETGIVSTMSE